MFAMESYCQPVGFSEQLLYKTITGLGVVGLGSPGFLYFFGFLPRTSKRDRPSFGLLPCPKNPPARTSLCSRHVTGMTIPKHMAAEVAPRGLDAPPMTRRPRGVFWRFSLVLRYVFLGFGLAERPLNGFFLGEG